MMSWLSLMAEYYRDYGFARMITNTCVVERVDADVVKAFNAMLGNNLIVTIFDPVFENLVDKSGQKREVLTEKWFGDKYVKIKRNRDEKIIQHMKHKIGSIVLPHPEDQSNHQ